eukprot:CAMPEP_0116896178 /NCGR_PEP_ID=MMETSP0467-20121206/5489_1 /TAXON_ID=283647 /ORGANISM="Mesodinium pulex, Strain SPMC105" /LENGTH=135 /DNA_ID=CAMNT_0004567223 /DNA_START=796 /DNA_END=1203 /DNA_ORIENTATION=+
MQSASNFIHNIVEEVNQYNGNDNFASLEHEFLLKYEDYYNLNDNILLKNKDNELCTQYFKKEHTETDTYQSQSDYVVPSVKSQSNNVSNSSNHNIANISNSLSDEKICINKPRCKSSNVYNAIKVIKDDEIDKAI